ncbi:hypothetical protein [Algibacillus agarilyticus]|uniref:hypothetical protein n=1 Tax=Algibacillus agarilyticus TaxID=2234133 RepID=UPI000DD000E1|nr:hypothetical protein [Algibacillus agarilyticus]
MNRFLRYLISFCLFMTALVFYSQGAGPGGSLFLIAGVIFEGACWWLLFKNRKKKGADHV